MVTLPLTTKLLALSIALLPIPARCASETVLAAYLFHRHGDRTAKAYPPTVLTELGYQQVYTSGQYYADRWLQRGASTPSHPIRGLSALAQSAVADTQLAVTSPADDAVLQNSATAFLQGLYPPLGADSPLATQTLRNRTKVTAPLDGYQLVPVGNIEAGAGSEDNTWLQDATGCDQAVVSSSGYVRSEEYVTLMDKTGAFYQRLMPVLKGGLAKEDLTFENAYEIYDIINCALIHNATIPSADLLDAPTVAQLRTLADAHEYGLAYNATSTARSIAGQQLAGEVLTAFDAAIAARGAPASPKLSIQFGPYATFLSFFGLSGLGAAGDVWHGVPGYASSMTWELFTMMAVEGGAWPLEEDLRVRFLFGNGSEAAEPGIAAFAPFGGAAGGEPEAGIPWPAFRRGMAAFAVRGTEEWCRVCGNDDGSCAEFATDSDGSGLQGGGEGQDESAGMSNAVAGVIGAMVTLAVIFGLEALVVLVTGLRLVSKKRLAASTATDAGAGTATGAGEKGVQEGVAA